MLSKSKNLAAAAGSVCALVDVIWVVLAFRVITDPASGAGMQRIGLIYVAVAAVLFVLWILGYIGFRKVQKNTAPGAWLWAAGAGTLVLAVLSWLALPFWPVQLALFVAGALWVAATIAARRSLKKNAANA